MLYLAWLHGGHCPYRLYHSLDEQYRPLEGGKRRPPAHPWRFKVLLYGFAQQAQKEEMEKVQVMSGGSVTRRMSR